MNHNTMVDSGEFIHSYFCSFCVLFWSSEEKYDDCILEGELEDWFPKMIDEANISIGISNPWPLEKK